MNEGKLIFIRHAYAPGTGDPTNFNIKDCTTQRILNKKGIKQSKLIKNFFIEKKFQSTKCYQVNGVGVKIHLSMLSKIMKQNFF